MISRFKQFISDRLKRSKKQVLPGSTYGLRRDGTLLDPFDYVAHRTDDDGRIRVSFDYWYRYIGVSLEPSDVYPDEVEDINNIINIATDEGCIVKYMSKDGPLPSSVVHSISGMDSSIRFIRIIKPSDMSYDRFERLSIDVAHRLISTGLFDSYIVRSEGMHTIKTEFIRSSK